MELLSKPKTEYLLEVSLEALHAESLEWLNEVEFWHDEMAFFYKLLHKKKPNKKFPSQELAALEKIMVQITGEGLDKVKNELQKHERSLKSVLTSISLGEEQTYRKAHRIILAEVYSLHLSLRTFKKNVYSFVQKYD